MTDAVAAEAVATTDPLAVDNPGTLVVETKTPAIDAAAEAARVAAEAAKPTDTPEDTGPTIVEYVETGDVGLDLALDFVGKLGIDHTHPAMVAAIAGDFTLIDAVLAGMGDKAKGYEKMVALAKKSYTEAQAADTQAKAQISAAVHDSVGGQAEWAAIQTWAKGEATPAEKAALNKMLTADPMQARAAAMLIKAQYDQAKGVTRRPATAVGQNASSGGNPNPQANLTRREAVQQSNALRQRLGPSFTSTPEYAAIWARVPAR